MFENITVEFDSLTARTLTYLVSGTTEEWQAMEAAEWETGLVADHADPASQDSFTVTLWRY